MTLYKFSCIFRCDIVSLYLYFWGVFINPRYVILYHDIVTFFLVLSSIIHRVTIVLVQPYIVKRFISFPVHSTLSVSTSFSFFLLASQFPGIIGTVDGTHVRILAVSEHEPEYVNRKKLLQHQYPACLLCKK